MADVKRILLIRTDRIGELLLTTPAMRAIRRTFPKAEITVVVNPASTAIVENSPYVNSIIRFDEEKTSRSFIKTIKFFIAIKKAGFDLAVIFNPSKFFNILTFLAGIPIRVGYDRKLGFLLSHKIKDRKYLCEKHEVEYNLDLLGLIGINADDKTPSLPLDDSADKKVKVILGDISVREDDLLVAVHPATSNPMKMWPVDRFAQISDRLIEDLGVKIILIGGEEEAKISEEVKAKMKNAVSDLTGALSIKELGSFLKRCIFLISNDSGPVHIAAAVGTPTVVFFGEERSGGSSKRWGPYGEGHFVISKPRVCEITVDEAYTAAKEMVIKVCRRS